MTTHAPMARVPFAPLDNPRLQHLASAKNRQNGVAAQMAIFQDGKPFNSSLSSPGKSLFSPSKRPFEPTLFDDADADGENVDPATFTSPSKRSKNSSFDNTPVKPFAFTFKPSTTITTAVSSTTSMGPPPSIPSRLSTPIRANMSSPRAPLTAPAGRSPKRKSAGVNKLRRVSAPFSRIDPPAFSSSHSSTLPFSLDAALNGTLTSSAAPSIKSLMSIGAAMAEPKPMPKAWHFEIYEDTPEEEAATIMEHSTLTLDLSSDDEGSRKARDDRGKENCPPEGYDAATASRAAARADEAVAAGHAGEATTDDVPKKQASNGETVAPIEEPATATAQILRKKKVHVDAMDDGMRSPLAELETEAVADDVSKSHADTKGEILVWEDEDPDVSVVSS